ncbi:MAG TPA: RpiB/LacA/LacB family sugar-phosphate isomerase [Chloroflexus aurantiacus]|uniref:Sugar-phosphate isomerase, RpiB/LacA/LacB family n=1 Tax=Chloroflexus aurantiacus (strain ATCC 29366 / DSM 635 / J-10-fl) TaxID=324602 RepID=A9WHG5_CHLAA|nr:RpiB/LacA/LacB family sugar-phosphate isomerase [Chloroflexus aurantiacus]ABY36291.1 sugar-phosphate isomerase, RpiB/LacA/LacB family [Chloroflexus aurantiacus J-10-fl]GIV94816.1 MAG: ribose 5-phosphate isomerase B [Chloroflexus sp.]HBW67579.1 RpiB/LacA/LacB family sugar-phosphate isomerase [Chloroflexus aurantiacus]
MRIAVGSDERTYMTDALITELKQRGHDVILFGPLAGTSDPWPDVGRAVGEAVATGQADQGIVCCYTGTGVSIAANKVPGIRAALCHDAQTAAGARKWNDANVLALSLRTTTPELVREILDAWFATECPPEEQVTIDRLRAFDKL